MKRKAYSLEIFDEPAAAGTDPGAGGTQPQTGGTQPAAGGGQQQPAPGGFSYSQLEDFASARAQRAERAALADYFKKQGLDEAQVTEAISAYKAAKKAQQPDVETLTRERDEAQAKVAAYEQQSTLTKKGVKAEYADYVAFKVRELMKSDEKLDSFEKAADKFLKDNPQYGGKSAYRMKSGSDAGAAGGGQQDKADKNAALNAAFKSLARRGK